MKARVIRIGNSQGVRLPKLLLQQSGLSNEVEIEARTHQIIITSASRPREGWDEAFGLMAALGDDRLLDPESSGATEWDKDEWQW